MEHPGRHGPDHRPAASRASRPQDQRKRKAVRSRPRSVIPRQPRASREHGQESLQATRSPAPNRSMTTRQPAGPRPILALPGKPARQAAKAAAWPPRAGQPGHLSGPVLRRTPRSVVRRTPGVLPPGRIGAISFSPTPAGHGSPSRASPATRPHPFRPNARRHARVLSRTHDLDDLHHLMKDGRALEVLRSDFHQTPNGSSCVAIFVRLSSFQLASHRGVRRRADAT
jgi:hypothetical protein